MRTLLLLLFLALPGWAWGQWVSGDPTIDGTCTGKGYSELETQSGVTYYVGWNDTYLFFCKTNVEGDEPLRIHLDLNPNERPRSGDGNNGNLDGPTHWGITTAEPFRSDVFLYAINSGDRFYQVKNNLGGWGSLLNTGMSVSLFGGNLELRLTWSDINNSNGKPSSFNWYAYKHTRNTPGNISHTAPTFNPTGFLSGPINNYFYHVANTTEASPSNPFSQIHYTYYQGTATLSNNLNIHTLVLDSSPSSNTLSTSGSLTLNTFRSFSGTLSLGTNTLPVTAANVFLEGGTLTLSTAIGGDLVVGNNLTVNGGNRNYNNRAVIFNGTGSISGSGSFSPPFFVLQNGSNVTLQRNIVANSLIIDAGGVLNAGAFTIDISTGGTLRNNGTLNAGTSTINILNGAFIRGSSSYSLYNINARGRTAISPTVTIDNNLAIKSGAYLSHFVSADGLTVNDSLPNYGPSATLAIEGAFTIDNYAAGWGDTGSKLPSNISIGGTGNVTIGGISDRTVSGTLTLASNQFITNNKLILAPNARISSAGTGTISGNVTIQRELPFKTVAENTGRFFAFGYPHPSGIPYRGSSGLLRNVWIQGATEGGGSTTSGSPNIFTYNNAYTGATAAGAWTGVTNPNITVARGQGFMAYLYDFQTFGQEGNRSTLHSSVGDLTGENGSGEFSPTLSFATNPNSGENGSLQGLNFIANPFAAPIYWHNTNLTRTHVYDGYWVVNAAGTGFDAIAGDQTGDAVSIGIHQGFFVRTTAADPSLAINVAAKNPVPPSKNSPDIRLQIALESIEGQREDQSVIRFLEEDSQGMNFLGALTNAYSLMYLEDEVGRKMDVIDLNMSESGVLRFPVQIGTTSAGSFALAITENSLPGEWQATLVDLTNGRRYPAESGARIEFVSEASTVEAPYSRFMLELQNGEATNAEGVELPSAFVLSAPAPNPFRGATTLDLRVETAQTVTATLYDVLGREVAQLFHGDVAPGQVQQFRVNGETLNAGVYFVRVDGQTFTETRRLVRIQ